MGLLLAASVAEAKLNVVATTADLGAIAKEIGGNDIELTTLGKPTEDPHFVDAKPSFIVKLNHADVVVEGGAELEIGWLPALLDQARNSKIVSGAPGHISCADGRAVAGRAGDAGPFARRHPRRRQSALHHCAVECENCREKHRRRFLRERSEVG